MLDFIAAGMFPPGLFEQNSQIYTYIVCIYIAYTHNKYIYNHMFTCVHENTAGARIMSFHSVSFGYVDEMQ